MKINGLIDKLGTYEQQKVDKNKDKQQRSSDAARSDSDKVTLSSQARSFKDIQAAVKDASDVRIEKVEEIKSQVASGDYRPDSRKIAQKLLEEEGDFWS